jgi:SAM-dependent methyltransferase
LPEIDSDRLIRQFLNREISREEYQSAWGEGPVYKEKARPIGAAAMLQSLKKLRGSGLKTRLLNPRDELWDQRLGVRTLGFLPAVGAPGSAEWQGHYVPTPYRKIIPALRHVGIGPDDVFVDLGSGLGRTVFAASWLGARRAVGVEIDAALTAAARTNLDRTRLRGRDIEFLCLAAQEYDFADATLLYMFHPFGAGTMEAVIRRLEKALEERPRSLRIVYENPVNAAVLERSEHLERTGSWPAGKGRRYETAFWRSRRA